MEVRAFFERNWRYILFALLTVGILCTVIFIKFGEGGWLTILITSSLIFFVVRVRKHYDRAAKLISRLDHKMFRQVEGAMQSWDKTHQADPEFDTGFHTACICVTDFNGIGINTFL